MIIVYSLRPLAVGGGRGVGMKVMMTRLSPYMYLSEEENRKRGYKLISLINCFVRQLAKQPYLI